MQLPHTKGAMMIVMSLQNHGPELITLHLAPITPEQSIRDKLIN